MRAPPGLELRPKAERRGRRPGARLPRYHPCVPAKAGTQSVLPPSREHRSSLGELDFDVHAGGQIELHQRVDRLRRRLHDVEQPLVGPHLELLARLLVDVRRAVDGELLDARRQRNGTADERTGAARRIGDVARRLVEHSMIERLQADADILRFHSYTDCKEPALEGRTKSCRSGPLRPRNGQKLILMPKPPESPDPGGLRALYYFVISATTPAPTVRPPSRMAKRRP